MDIISLLRFLGTILITNSHFGNLYPTGYSVLGTGGMIGNALFFFCSGFTLYLSVCKSIKINVKLGNIKWLAKRLFRIYFSVWIFRLVQIVFLSRPFDILDFIVTGYWFLDTIIIAYFFFYFIIRYYLEYIHVIVILVFVVFIGLLCFSHDKSNFIVESLDHVILRCFYLFDIMLIGALMAKKKIKKLYSLRIEMLLLVLSVILYYAYKGILIKYSLFYMQLLLPVFLFGVVITFFRVVSCLIKCDILKCSSLNFVISYISTLTLDIYIVQFVIIDYCVQYKFPMGYSLAIILILIASIILNYLSQYLFRRTVHLLKL